MPLHLEWVSTPTSRKFSIFAQFSFSAVSSFHIPDKLCCCLNSFGVVGFHGTGKIGFEAATTAVLIEGFIFLILAVTGVRFFVAKLIPEPVRFATPAAIGAFLAHLGLQTAEGIGLVVGDIATAVTLGGCPEEDRTSLVALTEACYDFGGDACVPGGTYTCDNVEKSVMTSGTAWVGILGMLITGILLAYKNSFAFVVGIGFISFISWIPDTEVGTKRSFFLFKAFNPNRFLSSPDFLLPGQRRRRCKI